MFSKKCVQSCLIFLGFLLAVIFGQSDSLAVEKKALTWGSTSSTSGHFIFFVMTAKILNENIPEINVTVRSTGASVHNARLFGKGEIDLGGIDSRVAQHAMEGKDPFKGNPVPDLRLLHPITNNNAYQFVVSERSGVKTVYDLEGKPFTAGMRGSSAENLITQIFRVLGVRPKLRPSSYSDAIENMKNEIIVGFGKAAAPDASILNVMAAMKVRILSLSDEDIEKLMKNIPGLSKVKLPAGVYPGLGEIKTVETQWCVWAKKDFPEELAYKYLKYMWQNRAEIKKTYKAFVGDQLTDVVGRIGAKVYLHPGAVKFYREELGFTVPEKLIPPEMRKK